jgi:hypothetical protein
MASNAISMNEYEAEAWRWYIEALDEGCSVENSIQYARCMVDAFFHDGDVRQSFWDWLLI